MPRIAAAFFAALLAASLVEGGAVRAQDAEMSRIDALSGKLGVPMAEVDIRNQRDRPGRGTAVHATVNNAPWTCFVDDMGKVTSVERG
jgi:hypothetical protein